MNSMRNGIYGDSSFLRSKTSSSEDPTTEEEKEEGGRRVLEGSGCSAGWAESEQRKRGTLLISDELQTWDRIKANRVKLRDDFAVNFDELVRSLVGRGAITSQDETRFQKIHDTQRRFDEICVNLFRQNPQIYVPVFPKALSDIGRQDVVEFLKGADGQLQQEAIENKYKGWKLSDLANVLGRKDGRNLPLICRSLLETGHRQIAEDLLRSTKEDLTAYYVDTDVTKYHNEVLLALEREISLPHFKSPVESIKKSGGEMDQFRSLVESLKKSEEERMYQFKGIFDCLEKSKIQRADQLLLLVSYILLYVLGQ
ncbi:unnamed protein product [Darwinula stevensoni]|uniref:Uncharacterized protein n=1 Tax=Darwinula stevensoni TaxID=69355 RepID=A0A7R9FQH7_9CRUS|nr:unnamed protein product [Darwinula stevensoni]CAG0899528.1 unnamed protein product [Darwinula stevensoni]